MAKELFFECNGKKLIITPVKIGNAVDREDETPTVLSPGRGVIEISNPLPTKYVIPTGESITCEVMVSGKNIAQLSSGLFLQIKKSLVGPISQNFLLSPEEREIKGIRHPRWGAENEVEFEMLPKVKLLYCGEGFTLACMVPEQYGAAPEAQVWSIDGVYQRGGGEPFRAKFDFDDKGELVRKVGFYTASLKGLVSPFELFIEDGDTFEPYVLLLSHKGEESLATASAIMLGGGNILQWREVDAPIGTYQIGVVVEDFDSKVNRKFTPITLE
jgi:hypothetical protein